MESFRIPRPTTFRVNTLKADRHQVLRELSRDGFETEPAAWYSEAFALRRGNVRQFTETRAYRDGLVYVQSFSSMLPPLILDPKPGDRVLDLAAAPGSKTTQLAVLMHNTGEIVANDTSRTRSYRLNANLALQGVTTARLSQRDGRSLWQTYPEYFDKTLADVPCSMEGRFDEHDPASYKDWSLKKVKDLSHLQRWMLRSAVSATKPGGTIVYSTCTLSPEENEEVVDWILDKEKGNIALDTVVLPGFRFDPPVLHWGGKHFDQSIGKTARILPSSGLEGFFIATFKKTRSSVPSRSRGQMSYNT